MFASSNCEDSTVWNYDYMWLCRPTIDADLKKKIPAVNNIPVLNIIHISQYLHFQMSVCDNIMNTNCELNKMGVSYSIIEKR